MKRAMRRRKTWQRQAAAITAAMMAMSVGGIAYAMPQGEVIRSGKGEITRQDKDMTVNQDSKRLAIDWSGFDIANDERVTFRQPDKDSVALNRVVGDAASVIDGTLSGNGHVYVINPNGVLFGKNASVDVGSLVASTAKISDSDMTNFANADGITIAIPEDSSAKVINAGTIRAEGGLVVLHAAEVENSGTITNPEGTTALAAARNLSLSADTAGKINFTVDGALAKAKALNSGVLKADGGYLVMTARSAGDVMSTVVNNTGTMEAKTLRQNEKGEILLDGGDNGIVELNGTLDASGMEAGQSAGSIKAIGAETHVEDGATLHAIGAVDGGLIENSGDYLEIGDNVDIDAAGKTGKAGEWLLDPLEVVISDSQPTGSSSVTNGDTDGSYNSSNNASGTASRNKTTWVNSNTVNRLLNKGTAVSVQATDANKVASITLDSAINKTSGKDTSLTLEAQRNVTVNKEITSTSGALNVNLHSDTDGDGLGAVLINADIATNGGTFKSVSGTTIESGSVGTYFGNQGKAGDRKVTTNGGAINLYGDVAIGLNGGTLTLDTKNKTTGASGVVKVTGTVDSGNSYKRVSSGLEGWEDFIKSYYDEVMSDEDKYTAPTYTLRRGAEQYPASEYSPRYVLNSDDTVSQITSGSGYRWRDLQATGNTVTLSSYDELSASQKSGLSSYLARQSITWAGAKAMAQGATEGKNHTGNTYLATITTALENSLASPPEEYQLIVGGRGSGNKNNPVDRQYPDGYYWVTGPEGMANNGKGTKFAKNDGSAVNNYYVKWNYSYSQDTKQTEKEPNNSGPIVSIGFGTASNWDDVKEGAGTIRGFVQEKNLVHSGLVINAGDSQVDIAGNIGNSVALKNVEINAGDVAIGSGSHYTGIVHTDEGVSITGKNVTVGDRITADTKGVDIQATGDIDVDGITAHENINLTTTGESGAIVLNRTHNDGALITKSTDNDAVIIDARGTDGSFKNLTTAENAITTGKDGNWKVYSASPDRDTFGKNLNSETTARWHASSQGGNGPDTYAEKEDTNKYIFQVQPTITVKADDQTKTYGDLADVSKYTTTATAYFEGRNGRHSVSEEKYTHAFHEGNLKDRYTGKITLSSEGAAAEKTRMDGDIDRTSSDNARPYFVIKAEGKNLAGKEGYAVTTENGTLEILRRDANINGTGTQTYGTPDISWTTDEEHSNLVNGDVVDTSKVSIREGSDYTDNQKGRKTADAGTYGNSVAFGGILNEKGEDASINYNLTGTGTIQVAKADLTVSRKGIETVYGTVKLDPGDMTTYTDLVNDDTDDIVIDNGNYGTAYNDELTKTNNVGKYDYKATLNSESNVLRNYNVHDDGTNYVDIKPLNITENNVNDFITNATYTMVYGSKKDFGKAVFTGVNGDGTRELSITGSSALTGNTEGVITKDAAENAYNTVVSLDGLSEQDKKNYGLEDTSSFTFDNSATVEKADLTVSRKGIETVYGTVKKDPGDMTTYTDLVNDDTDDIVIDNGNYGTAYNDELTKTNNVGKYDYKATLNSESNVLRNYNVHDDGTNYVDIKPLNITENNVNDFITNATYTMVYGSKKDFGKAVFTGVNGDGTRELSITGSSALTGNTEGVITKDAAENAYNTVVSLDGLSEQDKKNYGLEDTSSFTFDNSATVEKADLTVSRKGIETVYGTVKKDPGDMTTYTDLVNDDTDDIVIDNGNYGTAYNDELTKTNNVGKYDYKATLNSASDVLRNYNVIDKDTNYVNITPLNITEDNVNDFITNATYTTVYGSKADFGQAVFTGVNGDGTRELSITGSSALTGNTEGVITKDAAENAYNTVVSLDGLSEQDKKNYGLEDTSSFTFDNSATVEKADLTVYRKGIDTVYGTVKKDPGDMTTYTTLVNGDTNDIVIDNGNYGTAYNDELTKTNNVGKYNYKATLNSDSDVLRNYNVHDDGTNYVNITPYTITEQEVVNLDGSPLYTTKYGQKDAFGTATFTGVNGDGTYELEITDSSALKVTGENKVTRDVGKNIYDTTVELSEAMNGNYQFADGATSKTFEKTASVTPAELTIKTKDVETEYGTVKTTTSEVDGLRNGDLPTGFIYDYGNYGGAYLDGNTKTNNVNTYHFGTKLSGAEFLKNYTITGGEADVKIDPKDVTFFVSGTGNTLTDVTYTVDPDIDAQLAYGEHVDADYTPGNTLGDNQYGVVAHINGTPIISGNVAGNYRYNYEGLITLSPTVPTKPDIDPHNPSNLDGSGSWTSNMGNHGVPGVERVAGLASAELPFFKVEAGQVSHYGTYDVAADPDKVRLEPTGKRLPEPNQPKTQYREYTKALTTTDGTGMFRMVYDGSTFNITPVDDGALTLMRMGDVKNNVELSAEALHAGFSEMGILLEDLDGVYVHFDTMA
nr:filamentous hemagglutinin N-terminal domain-containing protein [Mitsuokella multacida]